MGVPDVSGKVYGALLSNRIIMSGCSDEECVHVFNNPQLFLLQAVLQHL